MRGRFPIGVGTLGSDTYALGDTGGSARVALAITNMPTHSHTVNPPVTSTGNQDASHTHNIAHTHNLSGSFVNDLTSSAGSNSRFREVSATTTSAASNAASGNQLANHQHNVDIPAFDSGDAGSGTAHENRPPFLAINFIIKAGP
jgi:microcystin-dependent protein